MLETDNPGDHLIHIYPSLYRHMALKFHNPFVISQNKKGQKRTHFSVLPFYSLWFLFFFFLLTNILMPIYTWWQHSVLWFIRNCWKIIVSTESILTESNCRFQCPCFSHYERENIWTWKQCFLHKTGSGEKTDIYLNLALSVIPPFQERFFNCGCWLVFHCVENQTAA